MSCCAAFRQRRAPATLCSPHAARSSDKSLRSSSLRKRALSLSSDCCWRRRCAAARASARRRIRSMRAPIRRLSTVRTRDRVFCVCRSNRRNVAQWSKRGRNWSTCWRRTAINVSSVRSSTARDVVAPQRCSTGRAERTSRRRRLACRWSGVCLFYVFRTGTNPQVPHAVAGAALRRLLVGVAEGASSSLAARRRRCS